MKKVIAIILTVFFVANTFMLPTFAENDDNTNEHPSLFTNTQNHELRYYLPGNMRGVILRSGETSVKDFDEIDALGMNTVIIDTREYEDENSENAKNAKNFYSTDINKSGKKDLLLSAVETARERGLNVYLTFSLDETLNKSRDINELVTEIHKFTLKYYCDGIILDGYYSFRGEESFGRYMEYGAAMGYDNWLYDSTENFFKAAADTIRLTDNSIPVGIMLDDFSGSIAPPSGGKSGSNAGFADTLAFINEGYADFAMVNTPDAYIEGDSESVAIPFAEITDYWGEVCDSSEIPMYIVHHNQRIGEDSIGWKGDDQLLRQLSAVKKTPAYSGSVFFSYPALKENKLNSTDTLLLFFDDRINEETLFDDLIMNAPKSQNFSTNDSFAVFQGTYDDNFDVFLNDEKLELNEAGNFYLEMPLKIGANSFTLKHKGKTVNYSIERKVVPLHSISEAIANGTTLQVEGETIITIEAIAYKGASVTANINGQNIKLTQQDYNLDEPALNGSYAPFAGSYKAPSGIIGQIQDLGVITVTASISGYSRSIQGANVRIIALPEAPYIPPVDLEWYDQNNLGTGEVVARMNPIRTQNEPVNYVRILNDNTDVFPANTIGTYRNPDYSYLPAGTIDYHQATVGDYYITMNGKRVSAAKSVVESGTGMGENNLAVLSCGNVGKSSFFKISLDHRSSFNIKAAGLSYSSGYGGDFNVSNFTPTFIYIDFDNVTSVTKLPSFENNLLFSSGKWESVTADGIPKFRLVLELRRGGGYAGHYSYYSAANELTLTFKALPASLSGMNIFIDPGHGVTESGFDPGAIGHIREFDANIQIARKLADKLRAAGANVTMLSTDTNHYATRERPNIARNYDCDLFLSLHCNAAAGSNALGSEVWYFTPFSQPLASSISSSISSYFQNNVYSDGALRNRGAKYSYYLVTLAQDFPSVLVEMGFVTGLADAMALASEHHQSGIADSIVKGIQNYLNR